MKLSPTQIQEIAERAEKATPGPWAFGWFGDQDDSCYLARIYDAKVLDKTGDVKLLDGQRDMNAEGHEYEFDEKIALADGDAARYAHQNLAFCAHARTDIPALLAHIAAQDGERKEINSLLMRELTPSGSEFHDDPRACIEFAKKRMNSFSMSKLAELKAQIAKLERERDEQRHLIQEIAAENMRIFIALGGHPDEPRSDMELLDDLFNQFRRAESDRDEARARIAQLESQIAMKDGALKQYEDSANWGVGYYNEAAWYGVNVTLDRYIKAPWLIAREALKGSAK